jgi:hypothetical protein
MPSVITDAPVHESRGLGHQGDDVEAVARFDCSFPPEAPSATSKCALEMAVPGVVGIDPARLVCRDQLHSDG